LLDLRLNQQPFGLRPTAESIRRFLLILNTRRLYTMGLPRAIALLTLLPFVKFALILYLSLVPTASRAAPATHQ
jgi:hypothetical protein